MKRISANIGFSAAVTLIVLNLLSIKYVYAITIGLAVVFAASLILPVFRHGRVVPVCMGSAIMACLIFICLYNGTVAPQLDMNGREENISFYITDVSESDGDNFVYTIKTTEIDDTDALQNIKIKLKSTEAIDAEPYRIVNARIKVYSIGDSAFGSYGNWGRGIYMSGRMISYTLTDSYVKSLWKPVLSLRQNITDTLFQNIGGDSGALAVALLTGNKSKMSSDSINNFKYAGASHLMAVSGFHLTVMIGAVVFILKRMRINDRAIAVISIIGVILITGLAGFSKSVLRAGIMMIVMLLGRLINRRADGINSLGFAVFLICLNPFAVTDIGAMLSVLSVLSLLTLHPHFMKLTDKKCVSTTDGFTTPYDNKLWLYGVNGFIVALSVMVYTLPVMYLFFGYASLVSLVSNIILVPLGSACIVVSFLSFISIKIHFLSAIAIKVCGYLNGLILWLVHRFASLENSVVSISWYFCYVIALILIAFAVCFFMNKKQLMKWAGAVSLVIVVLIFSVSLIFGGRNANVLVGKNGAIAICCDDRIVVYNVTTKDDYYSVNKFLTSRHSKVDTIISPDNSKYSYMLADNFSCDTYVTSQLSNEIIACTDIEAVQYCLDYYDDEGIICDYHKNNDLNYCLFTVNNVTIAVGNGISAESDIVISDKYAVDSYGRINLDNNEIIYSIDNMGVYKARRVDIWQK